MQEDITRHVSLLPLHEQHTHRSPYRKGFTFIKPKATDQSDRTGRAHRKLGFTLIELIVVMAVLAILVLLAAPKFLNYTEKARASQVVNDIKTLETKLDEYLIRHEGLPESFESGTPGGGQLYDRTGPIDTAPDSLKVVDKTFYTESTLPGDFYTTDKGDVIYEDNGTPAGDSGSGELDIDREFVLKPVDEEDKDKPLQGEGTESNPYRIWYLEHLKEIEGNMTGHYVMMRDLDFDKAESYLNPVENMPIWSQVNGATDGWVSVGELYDNPFMGQFDGSGYAIYNLFSKDIRTGLFASAKNSVIENISFVDVSIENANNSGVLFQFTEESEYLTLRNIGVSGVMSGSGSGGIFSTYTNSSNLVIENVYTEIKMSGDNMGGVFSLVRFTDNTSIKNIKLNNEVSGNYAGGLGAVLANQNGLLVKNIEGIVALSTNRGGGLFHSLTGESTELSAINKLEDVNVEVDITTGNKSQAQSTIGSIAGLLQDVSIERVLAKGSIELTSTLTTYDAIYHVGGLFGTADYSRVFKDLTYEGNISALIDEGHFNGVRYIGGIAGEHSGWDGIVDYSEYEPSTNIIMKGNVITSGKHVGGIFGQISDVHLSNIQNLGGIVSGTEQVGGIVGTEYMWDIKSKYDNLTSLAEVTGTLMVGEFFGNEAVE